jgi:hypothetical protein
MIGIKPLISPTKGPISVTCAMAHFMLGEAKPHYYWRTAGEQLPGEELKIQTPPGFNGINSIELMQELELIASDYGFSVDSHTEHTFYLTKL